MAEFDLIARHFAVLAQPQAGVALGIGDDAALLSAPAAGEQWAVSTDTLVEGVHFAAGVAAEALGHKALAVNLSDLAAMGARPFAALLALTMPRADDVWLRDFARGFGNLLRQHGLSLVGGDTTQGPLSVTVTVIGRVPTGFALRRTGAEVGDLVAVTGTLGDAALALQMGASASPELAQRLHRPEPRVAAGLALRALAHAAIDVSDGLLADLGHVCEASGVGASLRADLIPASPAFLAAQPASALALQVAGGDDYELCVCLPPEKVSEAVAVLAECGVALTVIGRCTREPGVRLLDADATPAALPPERGYRHFA